MSILSAGKYTITFSGFLVRPLPDLETASLAELQEAEWSGRDPIPAGLGGGAWHSCQCCGAVKIDGEGHNPGCAMAAALVARA
jgi:hypothetical protein